MILIVLGHVLRFGDIRNIVYSFHVPYFFFLSGVTEKDGFSLKRLSLEVQRLMIPYYSFGLASIAVYGVFGSVAASNLDVGMSESFWGNVVKLLYGSSWLPFNAPLWFLPCLFVTKLWYQLMFKYLKENLVLLIPVVVFGVIAAFIYTGLRLPDLPFSFILMLKLFPFFFLGRLVAKWLTSYGDVEKQRVIVLVAGLILLTLTAVLGTIAPPVNYTSHSFPNPFVFYSVALIGGGGIYLVSIILHNIRWLAYLGRKTMMVLTMHKFPVVFFQIVGPFETLLQEPDSLKAFAFGGIPVTAIAVVMSLAVGCIIERYLPILLGKKRDNAICT